MGITASNRRRGSSRLSAGIIDELNGLKDGLGSRLAGEINQHLANLSTRVDAQAGHKGTVVMAPQKRRDASGRQRHSLKPMGRIGEVSDGLENLDAVNLQQLRSLFTCENFGGRPGGFLDFLDECGEQALTAGTTITGSGILPWFFGYSFHQPSAADVAIRDLYSAGQAIIWSMLVTESTTFNMGTYGIGSYLTLDPLGEINFGIYDKNLNLVAQAGGQGIFGKIAGFYSVDLGDTITLEPDEYYFAHVANSCNRQWSIDYSVGIINAMDANNRIDAAGSTSARHSIAYDIGSGPLGSTTLPDQLTNKISETFFTPPLVFFETV